MSSLIRSISKSLLQPFASATIIPSRSGWSRRPPPPRKRNPSWFVRKDRRIHEDFITNENREFIHEVVQDKYGPPSLVKGVQSYTNSVDKSLIDNISKRSTENEMEFRIKNRRTGVIAKKIGCVPLWTKDGKKIMTTMLQIEDNHVIRYIPPKEFQPMQIPKVKNVKKWGCLMIGAGSTDPSLLTKEYANMFTENGIIPKRHLGRFLIDPMSAIPPGTPLNVTHFRVGDYVDVRGKTIDRGFQGVMKRWGFKGMPATHGVTKTHRRPGNVGSGGAKARIWPGQKMPGHMGNRYRINRGLKIWRINTQYNVMWVSGLSIPGETNSICYVFDTMLPLKRKLLKPPYPTCFEDPDPNAVDIWSEELHDFRDPTIFYEPEEVSTKK